MIFAQYALVIIIGYLIGSIPFGLIISRRASGTDLTKVGSGKIGTTNVLRTSGKKAALLVLILDIAKGAAAVILAELIFEGHVVGFGEGLIWATRVAQAMAAAAAIGGHSWSVFLKFKGGRGVATFIGGLFALYWPAAIAGGAVIIIIGLATKYMSLGSISGAIVAFILLIAMTIIHPYLLTYVIFAMAGAIFIFVMHRDNVMRLVSGTERRLGDKVGTGRVPAPGKDK